MLRDPAWVCNLLGAYGKVEEAYLRTVLKLGLEIFYMFPYWAGEDPVY